MLMRSIHIESSRSVHSFIAGNIFYCVVYIVHHNLFIYFAVDEEFLAFGFKSFLEHSYMYFLMYIYVSGEYIPKSRIAELYAMCVLRL